MAPTPDAALRRDRRAAVAWWLLVAGGVLALLAATVALTAGLASASLLALGAAANEQRPAPRPQLTEYPVGRRKLQFHYSCMPARRSDPRVVVELVPEHEAWSRRTKCEATAVPGSSGSFAVEVDLTQPGIWIGRVQLLYGDWVAEQSDLRFLVRP